MVRRIFADAVCNLNVELTPSDCSDTIAVLVWRCKCRCKPALTFLLTYRHRTMTDLEVFNAKDFNPRAWINQILARPSQEPVERHLAELEMRLHLTAEDVEATLQEQSRDAVYRIPAAVLEVSHIKVCCSTPNMLLTLMLLVIPSCHHAGRPGVTQARGAQAAAATGHACCCCRKQRRPIEGSGQSEGQNGGCLQYSQGITACFAR